MEIREVVAYNLRKARQLKQFSQEELADKAGVDRTYISSLERSIYAASVDKLDLIAKALGLATYELLLPVKSG